MRGLFVTKTFAKSFLDYIATGDDRLTLCEHFNSSYLSDTYLQFPGICWICCTCTILWSLSLATAREKSIWPLTVPLW